jgi:hypothetical protein
MLKKATFSPARPWRLRHPPALSLPRQPLSPGTRLVPGKAAAVFHSISKGWPGRSSIARVERTPSERARSASRRTTRLPFPSFFSILLEAKDIEDDDAHEDAVVGKRSECMALHKREKGRDHNPRNDERYEHPDSERQVVVLLKDAP